MNTQTQSTATAVATPALVKAQKPRKTAVQRSQDTLIAARLAWLDAEIARKGDK